MVGGAYSGKRSIVRQRFSTVTLHSAYDQAIFTNWKYKIKPNSVLVFDGWEKWIKEKLATSANLDEVRLFFIDQIDQICQTEQVDGTTIILIMLEMGRGIVPLDEIDRNVRDIAGWLLQYATKKAETVDYCWHGLSKTIK